MKWLFSTVICFTVGWNISPNIAFGHDRNVHRRIPTHSLTFLPSVEIIRSASHQFLVREPLDSFRPHMNHVVDVLQFSADEQE
jgi:hypothetical protein